MKIILVNLIVLLLSISTSFGQKTYTGVIVDAKNQPISFANIVAYTKADSTLVSGYVSDDKGHFALSVDAEGIYLEASFIGYATQTIIPQEENIGTITLQEAGMLDEVVVTARKQLISQKPDRLVFNVENSTASSGGDALDLLKVTPGVNTQDDAISIIGKQEVKVMVNDRMVQLSGEELVSYLSSIASDDIKNIEVITTPPSKYDAEGNSGLINIVLKKAKADSWSNQMRASYKQATYSSLKVGNTFHYNKGKLKLLASLDANKGADKRTLQFDIDYPNGDWNGDMITKLNDDYISGRLGLDYDISSTASVGMVYSGRITDNKGESDGNIKIHDTQNTIIGNIKNDGVNNKDKSNHAINAHYVQKPDSQGRKLSVDLDYFTYQNDENRVFSSIGTGSSSNLLKANNISNQDINNLSAKLDIVHPHSWANMSYGAKATRTMSSNVVDYYNTTSGDHILDPNQSDKFDFTEDIQSLYFDMTKPFGKWTTKAGLRAERTVTNGISDKEKERNDRDYIQLFPTLYASYVHSPSSVFNFEYSRRVQRPGYWALNPARYYVNANSYVVGNPYLRPQISNNIEVKHIYKNMFITRAFVTKVSDGYGQVISVDKDTNQQIYAQDNFYTGYVFGLHETIMYNPTSWWRTVNQIAYYYTDNKATENVNLGTEMINGSNFQLYTNHNFFLNKAKTFSAEATFMYNGPQKMMLFRTSSNMWLDLGMKMTFLDKKLVATLTYSSILKPQSATTYTNGVKQIYENNRDIQSIRLGLSYKFGNDKINVRKRKVGNVGEFNRANK